MLVHYGLHKESTHSNLLRLPTVFDTLLQPFASLSFLLLPLRMSVTALALLPLLCIGLIFTYSLKCHLSFRKSCFYTKVREKVYFNYLLLSVHGANDNKTKANNNKTKARYEKVRRWF